MEWPSPDVDCQNQFKRAMWRVVTSSVGHAVERCPSHCCEGEDSGDVLTTVRRRYGQRGLQHPLIGRPPRSVDCTFAKAGQISFHGGHSP